MAENFQERTEKATPRRREKAREKGDIPVSKEIIGVVSLWMIYIFFAHGRHIMRRLTGYLEAALKRGFEVSLDGRSVLAIFRADAAVVGWVLLPIFGSILIFAIGIHFIQSGFLFTTEPLAPDLNRINPVEGVKKLFSLNTLFEAAKGVAKITAFGFVLYLLLGKEVTSYSRMMIMDIPGIYVFSYLQIKKLFLISAIILTLFAGIDFGYSRWKHERNIRMTRQELKEEFKEMEGDPIVKSRIRSLLRDLARRRMMDEVRKADFVVTNPTHLAVALKYDESKAQAPLVVAKGARLLAERIKEIARESDVPIFEDKPLARSLYKLKLGQEIPEILYRAVATILANVYRMKGKDVNR